MLIITAMPVRVPCVICRVRMVGVARARVFALMCGAGFVVVRGREYAHVPRVHEEQGEASEMI